MRTPCPEKFIYKVPPVPPRRNSLIFTSPFMMEFVLLLFVLFRLNSIGINRLGSELYRKDWKLISQSCLLSGLKRKFSCYLATSFVSASFSAARCAFICCPRFIMNVTGHLWCAFGPKSEFFMVNLRSAARRVHTPLSTHIPERNNEIWPCGAGVAIEEMGLF